MSRRYANQTLRIAELVESGAPRIRGVRFTNCLLRGPAQVVASETDLSGVAVTGDSHTTEPVDPQNAVVLLRCEFVGCTFDDVRIVDA